MANTKLINNDIEHTHTHTHTLTLTHTMHLRWTRPLVCAFIVTPVRPREAASHGSLLPSPQACGRFINNNAVTKMAQSSSKSPELLARYCDSLLKKR